ncbi:hypothetical protein C0J52_08507 [Blattella germanica]|nr:hypothetical protein C0J52_08507 [Blattella germanica]
MDHFLEPMLLASDATLSSSRLGEYLNSDLILIRESVFSEVNIAKRSIDDLYEIILKMADESFDKMADDIKSEINRLDSYLMKEIEIMRSKFAIDLFGSKMNEAENGISILVQLANENKNSYEVYLLGRNEYAKEETHKVLKEYKKYVLKRTNEDLAKISLELDSFETYRKTVVSTLFENTYKISDGCEIRKYSATVLNKYQLFKSKKLNTVNDIVLNLQTELVNKISNIFKQNERNITKAKEVVRKMLDVYKYSEKNFEGIFTVKGKFHMFVSTFFKNNPEAFWIQLDADETNEKFIVD